MDVSNLTITPIYWAPDGYSFPSSYPTIINQYLTDIAADSGKSSNTFAIDTEYYQMGSDGSKQNVSYNVKAGTPITVNDAFPQTATPCDVHAPFTACVNAAQIQSELSSVLAANNLPADLNDLYVVLFPPGVQTFEANSRSLEVYCGIHQSFQVSNGGWVIYADEPYFSQPGCSGGGQAPNGDPVADAEVSVLSHELSEAITDPLSSAASWVDSAGNEIGDECNFNFGPPAGSTDPNNPQTTEYNQVINGHYYYAQTMFSNAAFAAAGSAKGCIATAYSASTTAYTTADTDAPSGATVDASETKLPADGTSTSTLTLTELDDNGEPVSGDHVTFTATSSEVAPGQCGTLHPADGVTDDNGQVTTTYTASTDNVACIVLGVDAESGDSDWATIYQGTADDDQPVITDSTLPSTITPGGGPETFTVTADNPSSDDIGDARFDVFLTGDDTAGTGVTAGEVHLAYSDATTNGAFVNIPTSGETTKDGEIDAYAMPDKAADLPAGGSRTVTFQISLDAGAPSSSTTGAPLHVETDLDQFDPADGSIDNLDYVGPSDVTVGAGGGGQGLPLPLIIVILVAALLLIGGGAVLVTRRRGRPQPA
jgi:Invasin, domain 3